MRRLLDAALDAVAAVYAAALVVAWVATPRCRWCGTTTGVRRGLCRTCTVTMDTFERAVRDLQREAAKGVCDGSHP